MTTLRVVGRPAVAAGFALAGLPVSEVTNADDAAATLAELARRPDIGVLLVEEELLDSIGEPARRELLGRPSPIVVPFSGPSWSQGDARADAYVLELLRRAIGYRVRLR